MGKKWVTKNGYIIQQVLNCNNPLLISSKTSNILIDTGNKKNWMKLQEKISKILSDNGILSAVILTHTHHDHTQNARNFKNTYKSDIIVHKDEMEFLNDGASIYAIGNKEMYIKNYDSVTCDKQVTEKFNLHDYGFDAYVLHTPGHSIGSTSVIVDNEIAIVGDALGGFDKKPFSKTVKRVPDAILKSLEKLIDLKCSLYLPAHKYQALKYNELVELYKNYLTLIDS